MSVFDTLFDRMIADALDTVRSKNLRIYTFAFYYSHEDRAVSICIDSFENSKKSLLEMQKWSTEQFLHGYRNKDLEAAMAFSNIFTAGRSLSLGDFAFKNLAWNQITKPNNYQKFAMTMIGAIERNFAKIKTEAVPIENLVFCCSGKNDGVQYVWSALAFSKNPQNP